jgi:ribulose-phosphate 3-epimerase
MREGIADGYSNCKAYTMGNPEIIPGILAASLDDFALHFELVRSSDASWVHIDIADGQFVPTITVMPSELSDIPHDIRKEAHIMAFHPERFYADLLVCGVERVLLHREAFTTDTQCQSALLSARGYFTEVGLVINPETAVPDCSKFPLDVVQCMGVQPGKSGQVLLPMVYTSVAQVVAQGVPCSVDGGLNEQHVTRLHQAGVQRFVLTSQLFKGAFTKQFHHFLQVIQGGYEKNSLSH